MNMDKQKGIIVGTMIGSAVGAAIAVLTTPKSGPELRSNINDKIENSKNKAEEAASILKEKIDAFTEILDERSPDLTDTVIEEASYIVAEAKKALEELRSKDEIDAKEIKKIVKSMMKEEMKSGKEIGKVVKEEIKEIQRDFKKEIESLSKKIS
jgi:gas vesicle protein